jgi:hypothetical protein
MFAAPNKKEAEKLVLEALKDSLDRVKTWRKQCLY